ncbi:S-layer homology domain-containing protein [Bacillus sp. CGMCC 1.16541]|uniref:S-layer homology domain-containing protein n=1 Tax=Bacillus sp. CGMCC 1.16541 TaxID=2185143 RepID=UPI000D72FD78|nr:S-layer homology domain-containing protein [Bacillus sp. CGMCC 1.16541]
MKTSAPAHNPPQERNKASTIDLLSSNGLTTGRVNNRFTPNDTLNRAQFTVLISRALDYVNKK